MTDSNNDNYEYGYDDTNYIDDNYGDDLQFL